MNTTRTLSAIARHADMLRARADKHAREFYQDGVDPVTGESDLSLSESRPWMEGVARPVLRGRDPVAAAELAQRIDRLLGVEPRADAEKVAA